MKCPQREGGGLRFCVCVQRCNDFTGVLSRNSRLVRHSHHRLKVAEDVDVVGKPHHLADQSRDAKVFQIFARDAEHVGVLFDLRRQLSWIAVEQCVLHIRKHTAFVDQTICLLYTSPSPRDS